MVKITSLTFPTKVPSDSLGWIGSLKRTSDKSLFPMALGSCGHRITHQLRPINMNGRSILAVTSSFDSSPVVNRHVASPWAASILPWPDLRGKFPRLAMPITPVLLPALVRSGVERPACFLLKTSEPSLPPKRTECPGHSHSSLLVSSLFSRISSISWFALFVLFFPFAYSSDQPVPPNLEPPLRQPSLPPRACRSRPSRRAGRVFPPGGSAGRIWPRAGARAEGTFPCGGGWGDWCSLRSRGSRAPASGARA